MLEDDINALVAAGAAADRDAARAAFARLREELSAGRVRAAEPDTTTAIGWRVNTWVKHGILLGFRFGDIIDASMDHGRVPFIRAIATRGRGAAAPHGSGDTSKRGRCTHL